MDKFLKFLSRSSLLDDFAIEIRRIISGGGFRPVPREVSINFENLSSQGNISNIASMNSVIRTVFRSSNLRNLLNPAKNVFPSSAGSQRQLARNIWYMCKSKQEDSLLNSYKIESPSSLCSCGCGIYGIHTKGKILQGVACT